jgi:hypothetical protein
LKSGRFDEEINLFLISDENPFRTKEHYIQALEGNYYGGELEILVMSEILGKNIVVHQEKANPIIYPHGAPYKKAIHIWYNGNHYNLLAKKGSK